jgi:hypothetical protein
MEHTYDKVTIPTSSYKSLVQDAKRLQFLIDERCVVTSTQIWEKDRYRLEWSFDGYVQRSWYTSAEEAIDAQMEEMNV